MTPVEPGRYEYIPDGILDIRRKLNLKQREMAKLIDVPPNTLSRWETGTTTPDAVMLAKIYSIAMEYGITPAFFRAKKSKERHRLVVIWDFKNLEVNGYQAAEAGKWIRNELESKFSSTTYHLYQAFALPRQSEATDILIDNGWHVWEENHDIDDEIYDQCLSVCGQDPNGTILVLMTRDSDFTGLIQELKAKGVRVYLLAPNQYSQRLLANFGKKRFIPWPSHIPYLLTDQPL
jgi:transcriptional regulator with XRE-family HTH domain